MGRRSFAAGGAVPSRLQVVRYPPERPERSSPPLSSVQPPPSEDRSEHDVMYRNHRWLRVEEDVVLARLAHLTDLHDPWTAAVRLFADEPKDAL
ncbi:hypothetical protein BJF79_13540 [Actinomadura sp. CNU-125]|nr:hypothetical protein BJF79_13540 [Actinomadura sp. CNU-125]